MKKYTISNESLTVSVNSFGAEMSSIISNADKIEYLWNGDGAYWKRQSPILFPIVGSLKDKKYTYKGIDYPMGQHGFARDMEFEFIRQDDKSISFKLCANEDTKNVYPFDFALGIEYILDGKDIEVIWAVKNNGEEDMPFSIGGHPAFMCPLDNKGKQTEYYIDFHRSEDIEYGLLSNQGLLDTKGHTLETDKGLVQIDEHMFDNDALIIEGRQLEQISLVKPDGKRCLTVSFDTELAGLWSPAKKNAPFICIEPWYGRCDYKAFAGDLQDREYDNVLKPGQIFKKSYHITIE